MEYLKLFSAENDYLIYRDSNDYLKPNVSLSDDKGSVYYNYPPPIVYEAVDLGLPSHTKWAAQNVGARKPSDAGLYFQWGDTQGYTYGQVGTGDGKKEFASNWSDYKWHLSGSTLDDVAFTKYTIPGAVLELDDDAAHVNMGGDWRMPSTEQIQELLKYTTRRIIRIHGYYIKGVSFTSKSDSSKFIFIPAAGGAWDDSVHSSSRYAGIWSSMLSADNVNYGQGLRFDSRVIGLYSSSRYYGRSVRGVLG